MNEALNEAVYERFRFIEEKLYWLQFIRFFRGPFIVQMLHIPALPKTMTCLILDVSIRLLPLDPPDIRDPHPRGTCLLTYVAIPGCYMYWS
jgi:hypothetical protein